MAERAGGLPDTLRGYDPREVVSAFQKAVRRSDPDQALYWTFELVKSGFGAWWWKRARIVAVEDCSPEAPGLVADIHALNEQWKAAQKQRGDGHEILFVARAAISLATAPKSRVVDWAVWHHASDHVERRDVPDEALDGHTRRGRQMGRTKRFFLDESSKLEPWSGELRDLEAEYRDQADVALRTPSDASAPNPWHPNVGSRQEPAHNQHQGTSGQLPLGGER